MRRPRRCRRGLHGCRRRRLGRDGDPSGCRNDAELDEHAQLIDDRKGVTHASASTRDASLKAKDTKSSSTGEAAKGVGSLTDDRTTAGGGKEVDADLGRV